MDMEHNGPPHLDVQGGRPSPKRRCSTCQNQFRKVGSSEQKRRKNIGNHGESWKVMKKYGECGKKMEKIMIPISKSHGKFWILADVIEFHQQNSMKTGDPIGKQRAARLKNAFPWCPVSVGQCLVSCLIKSPSWKTAKSACFIIFACPIPTPLPIHQTRDRFSCIPPFWCGFKIVQENLQPAPHIRIAGGACSDVHPAKFLGKVAWNIPISPLRLICSCT